MTTGSSLQEVQETEGSRNWDSTVFEMNVLTCSANQKKCDENAGKTVTRGIFLVSDIV